MELTQHVLIGMLYRHGPACGLGKTTESPVTNLAVGSTECIRRKEWRDQIVDDIVTITPNYQPNYPPDSEVSA